MPCALAASLVKTGSLQQRVNNEFFGAIAIMDIIATMVNSRHLRCLCNGAVKRVVGGLYSIY